MAHKKKVCLYIKKNFLDRFTSFCIDDESKQMYFIYFFHYDSVGSLVNGFKFRSGQLVRIFFFCVCKGDGFVWMLDKH